MRHRASRKASSESATRCVLDGESVQALYIEPPKEPRNMRRRKQLTKAEKRERRKQLDDGEAFITDTARVFTCAFETAEDSSTECERRYIDVDMDLNYRRVAHEIWRDRTEIGPALATAMADLIAENERHRLVMIDLYRRFEALAIDPALRVTIDRPEDYFDIVRTRLWGTPQPL